MSRLRVMTLNLWNRDGPWEARMRLVRQWIERLEPDVVGFQEALRGAGIDQAAELVAVDGYSVAYSSPALFWADPSVELGNAIASRWPIRERIVIELPAAWDGDARGALMAKVATPSGVVPFVCTHLSWRRDHGEARERQAVALAEAIIEHRDDGDLPLILVGDFNAEPQSAEIRFLTGLQTLDGASIYLRDAWLHAGGGDDGITWSNRNPYARQGLEPELRIDYIFVGPPKPDGVGDVEDCRVVCDEPSEGVWPSDHFGVVADIRTEPIAGLIPSY